MHRDGDAAHNRPEAAPFRFNRGDADARDGSALRVHHLSGEEDAARNRDHDAALLFAWVESHRSAVRCRESFLRGFDLHFRFRKDIAEDETAIRSAESSCVLRPSGSEDHRTAIASGIARRQPGARDSAFVFIDDSSGDPCACTAEEGFVDCLACGRGHRRITDECARINRRKVVLPRRCRDRERALGVGHHRLDGARRDRSTATAAEAAHPSEHICGAEANFDVGERHLGLRVAHCASDPGELRQPDRRNRIVSARPNAGEISAARLDVLPVARSMCDRECAVVGGDRQRPIVNGDGSHRDRCLPVLRDDAALDGHAGVQRRVELRCRSKRTERVVDDRVIGMDDDEPVRPLRWIGDVVVSFGIRDAEEIGRVAEPDDGCAGDRLPVARDGSALHGRRGQRDCAGVIIGEETKAVGREAACFDAHVDDRLIFRRIE